MTTPLPQIAPRTMAPVLAGPAGFAAAVRHLYVHVPFCFHKCHYCDFYSLVDTRERQGPFTDRLCRELEALAPLTRGEPLASVFVGGGTPTLLAPALWERLLATMHRCFDLRGAEFTVECNPETATAELFGLLAAGGVNRVSIGAQSFRPEHLRTLERWHDPESVPRALETVRGAGIDRTSLDLIFAIPGQTLVDWREDLGRAIGLGVEHLSCYALTYEPNTAMTARLRRGEFAPAGEDLEADMQELAVELCAEAGLARYEVSNFAAQGRECAHNLGYWRQASWLAAGPSASGHVRVAAPAGGVGGWRWKNRPRLDDYLRTDEAGFPGVLDVEPPDAMRLVGETLMTGVRLREGVALEPLLGAVPEGRVRERLAEAAAREVEAGRLERRDGRLCPTDSGFLFADGVARAFLLALG